MFSDKIHSVLSTNRLILDGHCCGLITACWLNFESSTLRPNSSTIAAIQGTIFSPTALPLVLDKGSAELLLSCHRSTRSCSGPIQSAPDLHILCSCCGVLFTEKHGHFYYLVAFLGRPGDLITACAYALFMQTRKGTMQSSCNVSP